MSNGLNLGSIVNIASLAAGFVTGGATWVALAQQLFQSVATQAFSQALSQIGINGPLAETLTSAFSLGVGGGGNSSQASLPQQLVETLRDASNHDESGRFTGDLDRAQNDLADTFKEILDRRLQNDREEATSSGSGKKSLQGGGAESWLVAIAKALGTKAGEIAKEMTAISQEISGLDVSKGAGKDAQQENALKMNQLSTELQGQSQMYKILTDSISTTLKSIGDGMSGLSRRQ